MIPKAAAKRNPEKGSDAARFMITIENLASRCVLHSVAELSGRSPREGAKILPLPVSEIDLDWHSC